MGEERELDALAAQWIARWNARDVEGVLAAFADDVVFHSPKAQDIVGTGKIVGKAALRAYWTKALEHNRELHFELDHAAYDLAKNELFIVYVATLNGRRTRACERLRFADGLVVDGEGFYGAPA
jgi:ketosteroid isomerase-like protein